MSSVRADTSTGLLRIKDVMRALNIARRTVYTIPFLWERVTYVNSSPRWEPADIELYKRINSARRGKAA